LNQVDDQTGGDESDSRDVGMDFRDKSLVLIENGNT
jgi:hypothetical protein